MVAEFLQALTSKKDQWVRHGSRLASRISRGVENFSKLKVNGQVLRGNSRRQHDTVQHGSRFPQLRDSNGSFMGTL